MSKIINHFAASEQVLCCENRFSNAKRMCVSSLGYLRFNLFVSLSHCFRANGSYVCCAAYIHLLPSIQSFAAHQMNICCAANV